MGMASRRVRFARLRENTTDPPVRPVDPAFTSAYTDHVRQIHRYFARRLGGDVAEDLTADTFAAALGAWHRFDPQQGDVLPWLYGIAANIAAGHRRREMRQLRLLAHRGVDPMESLGHETDVVNRVDAAREARIAAMTLADMSDFDRQALLLLAWDGLSYEQIAQTLNVTSARVRSRLHEARLVLRAALSQAEEGNWQ